MRPQPGSLQLQSPCKTPDKTSDKASQKVQLIHRLFLLENARNELNKELDKSVKKVYEEVNTFLKASLPASAFKSLSETLDAKCQAIEKLSHMLRNLKFASQEDLDQHNNMDHNQPVKERDMFITRSIGRAVQVLGATLPFQHFKHLIIPQKHIKNTIHINQTTSQVQAKYSVCSATRSTVQEIEMQKEMEEQVSSHEAILQPATCDIIKTNARKLLLPPIPVIPPAASSNEPYFSFPTMKWGCEDDIQVQHQKQTSSQLLHFLKLKGKNTGALSVNFVESSDSFLGLPTPTCSSQNSPKQANKYKQEAEWAPDMFSETENHTPLFNLKRLDSGGSVTYTCVIATKTELWDFGDMVTDFESESSSVSSEDTALMMPCDDKLQWADAAMHNDATSVKVHTGNAVTIPDFQNKRFEEIEVVVSHIVNPGHFYIQHADAKEKLQTLTTEALKDRDSFAEQNCIPDIGTKVMGWFPQQKQWCRSQVTKICGISKDDINNSTKEMSITVEVKRLDYGDSFCLCLSDIKEMTSEMVVLPLQAAQVSLAHVWPVNGRGWSEQAVDWFRDMVHKRTLYARLYPEGHRVTAELFLEKGKIQAMRRGASLSLRLTQNGHAKHDKLKNGVGSVQLQMKKKDLEWEKYLISCYTQTHSHRGVL